VDGIDGSIDALVMNAGVIGPRSMELTGDGVTVGFATNVLDGPGAREQR
jgi:NAD(P)-dependent dehydrogenase (short-subunit alcohol dehydrogenase family)